METVNNIVYISTGNAQVTKLGGIPAAAARFVGGGAGGITQGNADGAGSVARFRTPAALAFDDSALRLYISDSLNYRICVSTTSGAVTTVAGKSSVGSTDGVGTSATFNLVRSLALSSRGDVLYAGESTGNIRMVVVATKTVTTLVGVYSTISSYANGPLALARLGSASGLAVTASGTLLFADSTNNAIRGIGASSSGIVSTIAGGRLTSGAAGYADGSAATSALFSTPQGVAVSSDGGTLWVADTSNSAIRRVVLSGATSSVSTLAGATVATLLADNTSAATGYADGSSGSAARFRSPGGITDARACGGAPFLVVADSGNNALRAVDADSGATRTLAAGGLRPPSSATTGYANGTGTASLFSSPQAAVFVGPTTLLVTDSANAALRLVSSVNGSSSTLLAGGTYVAKPSGAVFVAATATVYYSDLGISSAPFIRAINVVTGVAYAVCSSGGPGTSNGIGSYASFRVPAALAVNAAADTLFVCDSGNNALRTVVINTTAVDILCGGGGTGATAGYADGLGTAAMFFNPRGIAWVSAGAAGTLIVSDSSNNLLRRVDIASANVTTLAGGGSAGGTAAGWVDGTGSAARLSSPWGLVVNTAETMLYVADVGTGHIRKVDLASATVTTLAGGGASGSSAALSWDATGTSALFALTAAVQLATDGVAIYIASQDRVRRLALAGAVSSTLSGGGTLTQIVAGASDGTGTSAGFNAPRGVAMDTSGNVFVADTGNSAVRQLLNACGGGVAAAVTVLGGTTIGAVAGSGTAASFSAPLGVAVVVSPAAACNGGGGVLVVADTANNLLRNASLL